MENRFRDGEKIIKSLNELTKLLVCCDLTIGEKKEIEILYNGVKSLFEEILEN